MRVSSVTVSVYSESRRLSSDGMHQGRVAATQAESLTIKETAPGVVLEISQQAIKAASLQNVALDNTRVVPVSSLKASNPE